MCGIAGLINENNIQDEYLFKIQNTLNKRGPDHQDIWIEKKKFLFFTY